MSSNRSGPCKELKKKNRNQSVRAVCESSGKVCGKIKIVVLLLSVVCNSLAAGEGDGPETRRGREVLGLRRRALAGPTEAQTTTPYDYDSSGTATKQTKL
jgi:hypothetical protein